MIGENELEPVASPYRPDWVPRVGTTLRMVGVVFDAVRIVGEQGPAVADVLGERTGHRAGPIVFQAIGEPRTYFLVPPGSVRRYRWSFPAEAFCRSDERYSYVGVPSLQGDRRTWPLLWRSRPTEAAPFVDVNLLNTLIGSGPLAG
ncbi:hypothetical protein [Streptomyces hainanensis]|uniref:Uncharacterized protein n=1 Tax=Streptomyces hainanensis TaxID=402648 RepID=A0A4V2Y470_9ACTN|nr:hypothetical protein [Streptomyces hainanensis]TDC79275.1 hypothetical protein E1283_03075 [Streptomyces hainanensis]